MMEFVILVMVEALGRLVSEVLKAHQTLSTTKKLHALITRICLLLNPFYATKLVRFYSLNNDLTRARKLFDIIPRRSVFLWNSMIRSYARFHKFRTASSLYNTMLNSEIRPDNFTFACLIRACHENLDLYGVKVVHAHVIISGSSLDSIACSALVSGYSKMGLQDEASKVFCLILNPDLVLWNCMISCCSSCGFWNKALQLFKEMREEGKQNPDGYTFVGLISGLIDARFFETGRAIHALCVKNAFVSNDLVSSSFVSLYSRFNHMTSAHCVFINSYQPDLVSWSALISGFSQSGDSEKAVFWYKTMSAAGTKSDAVLICSVLAAVARLVDTRLGYEIHCYIIRHGFESSVKVSSALMDMYFKCGSVGLGIWVFENVPNKNIVSYNTVIVNLGLNGLAPMAFRTFDQIIERGLVPDASTFSALLSACCHSGIAKDGWEVFRRMTHEFGIHPQTEHYVHMVKLLGMAGELEVAYRFILSLKQPVDSGIWGALLSCCVLHDNCDLAEMVVQQLFRNTELSNGCSYEVLLSNVYASNGRWDDAEKVRDVITVGGLKKIPGISQICCSLA